jgi:hypothetical protein
MRGLVGALLLVSALGAAAQVYRWVGPDGTVHYTDRPQPGATPVDVPPVQTFSPGPSVAAPRPSAPEPRLPGGPAAGGYARFAIASPTNEEAVRANDGNVAVGLTLDPPLKPGHKVVLLLDGQPVGPPGVSLSAQLSNLERGAHRIEASVIDARGTPIISAGAVTFHVLRVALATPRVAPRAPAP